MSLRVPSIRPDDYDPLAALCKAAGDSLRLNVLRALANDSFGVLELAQIFAIGQSGMSHHLKVLAQAGLVATRREGNAIFYAQRAAVSQDFFARAADKFQAQQDLIAGLPQYRESVLALLDALAFAPGATALEVGPGDGGFLPELARRFRQVTALDNSAAMLELARQRCKEEGLGNVRLELADALQDAAEPADCVVLNMVLHHFAAPAEALKQLARLVHPGGSLLVTDLCRHNQGWAREACGDLWLGFEQEDLAQWADAAGLTPGESLYIGLRNGFQIQVRHFARDASESRLTHR